MGEQEGVFVSNSVVYNLLQDVQLRVIAIESKTETISAESERVRRLQSQVSAQWVIHSILVAYIVSTYLSR